MMVYIRHAHITVAFQPFHWSMAPLLVPLPTRWGGNSYQGEGGYPGGWFDQLSALSKIPRQNQPAPANPLRSPAEPCKSPETPARATSHEPSQFRALRSR